MTFTLGILGGSLQGLEVALLAKLSGWDTVLMDPNPKAPASRLATKYISKKAITCQELDEAFHNCDAVIPANENLISLELVDNWQKRGLSPPVAFDLKSFRISRDKGKSKKLFQEANIPIALSYPEASFPLIAKPVDRSGSQGVKLINYKEELEQLFKETDIKEYLLEEYCPGPSYSLELTGKPQYYKTWVTTYLEMDSSYDCRAVWSPALADKSMEDCFAKISIAIAEKLELYGLMDIEVINTERGLIVLEIDARFPSQTPIAVYLSSGINLLAETISLFADVPALPPSMPMFSLLEHLEVKNGRMFLVGEHRISLARPLTLKENFFGAPLALTDMEDGDKNFAASIMCQAKTHTELKNQRREVYERIAKHLGTKVPMEF